MKDVIFAIAFGAVSVTALVGIVGAEQQAAQAKREAVARSDREFSSGVTAGMCWTAMRIPQFASDLQVDADCSSPAAVAALARMEALSK